jgi:diaminopimelate decarboxylase
LGTARATGGDAGHRRGACVTGAHLPSTFVAEAGDACIGGCSLRHLAGEFGTPLQVLDAADLDRRADDYVAALGALARPARAVFATKALPVIAVVRRLAGHGIGADVTTAGELAVARAAGVPMAAVVQHGNARSREELAEAAGAGVGLVVLDGPQDVEHLDAVATGPVGVLVRITPGVAPATHLSMATAHHGQKFGVTLDEAPAMFRAVDRSRHLRLRGIHFHVGSQITTLEPFVDGVRRLGALAGFELLDAGGGLGVPLTPGMTVPAVAAYVETVDGAMRAAGFAEDCALIVEPGRSLVGRAMVTLYRVRTVKTTAGTTFVAVDGGTSDDLEAVTGLRTAAPFALRDGSDRAQTLVGLHCDSGDVLARDVALPELAPGDLVAMAGTGAYTFSLASNYNATPRPAVVEVEAGSARVVVRRETVDDLLGRQES